MTDNNISFLSLNKKLPVTAVMFSKNYILAGIGGDLYVFDYAHNVALKSKINVLDNFVIHGISQNKNNSRICVFGGKHIAVLSACFSSSNSWLTLLCKRRLTDWVLCCQWVEDQSQVVVLSAHNMLSLWDLQSGIKIVQVACMEKCMLHCATVLSGGWLDTVVFAGTVFQQLVIWAVAENSLEDKPVIHKLHGHKGVIFSITYDKRSHLLATTSDDRSIRVWAVAFSKNGSLTAAGWKDSSVTLAFTIFGHSARVWQNYILENGNIISAGEDALLRKWCASGKCLFQHDTHQGAGVWCLDVCEENSLIVTGGADGGISLWPVNPPPVSGYALPPPPATPRRVALLPQCQVVVTTEDGYLMFHDNCSWLPVFSDPRIISYCLLELSPSRKLIGLASITGHVIILTNSGTQFSIVLDNQVTEGRIFSLHWLSEDTLLSCHAHGNISIWRIHCSGLIELGRVYLPSCRERWTTAAVMIHTTVVYGDRAGNIHSSPIATQPSSPAVAVTTIKGAHSRLGVCSLAVLGSHVWSTGRDGIVKQFTVSGHKITVVSSSRLPIDWAVQTIYTHLLGLTVLCFHESSVVLWSITERRKLASMQCGGGHRSWSCMTDDNQLCFTYLKDKTAHILQCPLINIKRPVLMEGFHTREINSMVYLTKHLFVSGGEDGTVRMSDFTNCTWTTHVVECNHLSSVRSVHVSTLGDQKLLFSAGGRAQLKVWNINLNSPSSFTELCSDMLKQERSGRHWLNTNPSSDPETRYMDLHTITTSDSSLYLLAACSDSFLRVFHFDISCYTLRLVASINNSKQCMLRVTSFQCPACPFVAVTTSTDGSMALWNISKFDENIAVFATEYLHQSGVNGLSISQQGMKKNQVLVATGGDDNTLSVFCYYISASPQLSANRVDSWTNSMLHSSVITVCYRCLKSAEKNLYRV